MKKLFFFILFFFSISGLYGVFISPVPTGEILPHKTAALYVTGKMPSDEEIAPWDIDFALGFGLFNRVNIEFASYLGGAYGLNCEFLALEEELSKPRVSIGIDNITPIRYISSYGEGEDTRWEKNVYRVRNSEQFSAYGLIGKHIIFSDISIGFGRGKFVGYGAWAQTLNTDYYSDEKHNDAFGIFLNWKIFDIKGVKPYFSIDGRNYDYGIRFDHTYFSLKAGMITPNSLLGDDIKKSLFDLGIAFYTKKIAGEEQFTDIGILKGRVYDKKTVTPLQAMITISGKKYYNTIETSSGGSYAIELKEGIYNIHVSSDKYYWKEKTVSISGGGILYCNFKLEKKPKTKLTPEE
ncbi:MAG: hypothetical protein E3J87_10660 [Candidatus Cloacimonadota bacterium]|nr:MAG: hypothetical protein E3J87_10660 [Candidatus Cloacimonadota bacterium]